jgi:hypothetical protein
MLDNPVDSFDLDSASAEFLGSFRSASYNADAVPIYIRTKDGYAWVKDVACPFKRRGEFKQAPEGLFLSGAAVFALVAEGICVVPDERGQGCFKAVIQGWSAFAEGGNPLATALREGTEESVVFTMKDRTELIPEGMVARGKIAALGIKLASARVHGAFKPLRINENFVDRVIEFVFTWDLRDVGEAISFAYDDEFFSGGYMGANVHVLDAAKKVVGVFSGQQGFLRINELGLHSVISKSWDKLVAV